MNKVQYWAIMSVAKDNTNNMHKFFEWLEKYPSFADGHLEPIEIELSFLCHNIASAGLNYDVVRESDTDFLDVQVGCKQKAWEIFCNGAFVDPESEWTSKDYFLSGFDSRQEEVDELKAELELAKECLEFYGDIKNWFQIEDREFSDAVLDKGYFSRDTLKKIRSKT